MMPEIRSLYYFLPGTIVLNCSAFPLKDSNVFNSHDPYEPRLMYGKLVHAAYLTCEQTVFLVLYSGRVGLYALKETQSIFGATPADRCTGIIRS